MKIPKILTFFHSLVAQVFDVEGQVISSKEVNIYNHERPNPLVDDFFYLAFHFVFFYRGLISFTRREGDAR